MKNIKIKLILFLFFVSSVVSFTVLPITTKADTVNSEGYIELSPVKPTATITGCNMSQIKDLKSLINISIIQCLLKPSVYVIMALAIIVFLFGIFRIIVSNNVEEKAKGREFIFWGIIAIFVMVSVWGLVSILQNTFKLNTGDINPRTNITIPNL